MVEASLIPELNWEPMFSWRLDRRYAAMLAVAKASAASAFQINHSHAAAFVIENKRVALQVHSLMLQMTCILILLAIPDST